MYAKKKNKSMRTLIFGQMLVQKERINERRPYILVTWPSANKQNKSMRTLNFGRMVAHKKNNKRTRTIHFG